MKTTKRMSRLEKARAHVMSEERRAARVAEVAKAVECGCPLCGCKVKRNLAILGWWQCEQYGAKGFRADDNAPQCDWQQFAE